MSSIGISIILPTLNEEENLSKIIPEIISKFKKNNLDYEIVVVDDNSCLLYTSPSPRDLLGSRMPSSA